MLLSNDEFDPKELDYTNMYISIKRDGVRAEITNEGIKNRSLKILRNPKVQDRFRHFFESFGPHCILEGEIYSDSLPCREIAGICNSKDRDVPDDLKLCLFGMYDTMLNFVERNHILGALYRTLKNDDVELVIQHRVHNYQEAIDFYDEALNNGFEGAVLMDGSKKYKEGRVTIKQHIGYKLKPSKEEDLEIIGVTERMENLNESLKNELGQSYKRNTVDAKRGTGIAACFVCKYNGLETNVTITGDEESRREIWANKENYTGAYAVVKSMD